VRGSGGRSRHFHALVIQILPPLSLLFALSKPKVRLRDCRTSTPYQSGPEGLTCYSIMVFFSSPRPCVEENCENASLMFSMSHPNSSLLRSNDLFLEYVSEDSVEGSSLVVSVQLLFDGPGDECLLDVLLVIAVPASIYLAVAFQQVRSYALSVIVSLVLASMVSLSTNAFSSLSCFFLLLLKSYNSIFHCKHQYGVVLFQNLPQLATPVAFFVDLLCPKSQTILRARQKARELPRPAEWFRECSDRSLGNNHYIERVDAAQENHRLRQCCLLSQLASIQWADSGQPEP